MTTAVDSCILIDVLTADPMFGPASRERLRIAAQEGGVVACAPVWAEVSEFFESAADCTAMLKRMRIEYAPITAEDAADAGQALRAYRARGGKRQRISADALIAAHAANWGFPLLTRDAGIAKLGIDGLRLA